MGRGVRARGTGTCLRAFDASTGPGEVLKGNRGGRSWNARSRRSGTGPCMNYSGPGRRWGASGNYPGYGWTGQGVSLADDTVADEALRQALHKALVDEYKNQQYYEIVMETFGRSRRFENLARAEARHAEALLSLFHRYQLVPPKRDETKGPPAPESLKAAIELAIEQEIANVAMYDEFLQSEFPEDVRIVFGHLRDASASRHLPAIRRGL